MKRMVWEKIILLVAVILLFITVPSMSWAQSKLTDEEWENKKPGELTDKEWENKKPGELTDKEWE
jgi:hypothetical protein